MGAVPVRSHAPGYRGTRVLVHGLFLPAAAWELPPLQGEEPGAELGSLEEMGAACTEPSLAASSLGSWANECERADAALAAAEAQMGRGCLDESLGDDTATAGDPLEEEDWEWLTALGAAIAPPPPRPGETVDWPPGRKGTPKSIQGPPPATGNQKNPGPAPGKGAVAPKRERPPPKGPPLEGILAAPAARRGRTKTRSRW